ncbi:cytochrome P450 [Streptomyces sp. NPDC046866]|uniref:cytochrome P450 n=1 Tax=Streptomyces sp. NPDC046866 TaxID=3154921 RepID=UPI003454518A
MNSFPDSTLALLTRGYAWRPGRGRSPGGDPVRVRLLGRRAYVLSGPDAVGFFYDEEHIRRRTAVPGPVQDTLFGRGPVHTLDGAAHRTRKALFTGLLMDPERVAALGERVLTLWRRELARSRGRELCVFEAASRVLARAVCGWAGLPLSERDMRRTARDCVAMVDGWGTPGPRHWRARRARRRQEKLFARLVQRARAADAAQPASAARAASPSGLPARPPSVLEAVARHRDADGSLLDAHTAAVELLNVVRPTVAVAWFAAFAAHALHRWPEEAAALREDGGGRARAFAQEVRRFYPFAPFVGGKAATDLVLGGERIPAGSLVLLDVYGQNHDPALWEAPERFDPARFDGRPPEPDVLVAQGGGDARSGHRCPGEDITVALVSALAADLARRSWTVPEGQDLRIPLHRMPTRPRSGMVIVPGP